MQSRAAVQEGEQVKRPWPSPAGVRPWSGSNLPRCTERPDRNGMRGATQTAARAGAAPTAWEGPLGRRMPLLGEDAPERRAGRLGPTAISWPSWQRPSTMRLGEVQDPRRGSRCLKRRRPLGPLSLPGRKPSHLSSVVASRAQVPDVAATALMPGPSPAFAVAKDQALWPSEHHRPNWPPSGRGGKHPLPTKVFAGGLAPLTGPQAIAACSCRVAPAAVLTGGLPLSAWGNCSGQGWP